MKAGRRLAGFVTIGLLAGCTSTLPANSIQQDMTFARGCWIDRSPEDQTRTLRILPARDGSKTLDAELMTYAAGPEAQPMTSRFIIAADGSTFEQRVTAPEHVMRAQTSGEPPVELQRGWSRASWSAPSAYGIWIWLEGDGDHLRMWRQRILTGGDFAIILFNGDRDGCD